MNALMRNQGDGHEAEIKMQCMTLEDPKSQARNRGVFKLGYRGNHWKLLANISFKEN